MDRRKYIQASDNPSIKEKDGYAEGAPIGADLRSPPVPLENQITRFRNIWRVLTKNFI